ncbi:hypothetical protein [Parapedobacter soli]|uniref:hypothetical protein n=1 Tax=Parapedobacter soli TaxID=416955 RepID=UPI0021C68527|nr:hypothetical protein [Parapedobacter soli]
MKVETEFIDVPRDCKISCELVGMAVPDFLQLMVDHFSYAHMHMHNISEFDMATKAFLGANRLLGEKEIEPAKHLSTGQKERFLKLFRQVLKTSTNRNYSFPTRRNKVKVLAGELLQIYEKGLDVKGVIYYDEETRINLSEEFLCMSLFFQRTPTELLNAVMLRISYAEFYARYHLKQEEHNPAMAFFLRVMDGYGNIQNQEYLSSQSFKEYFLWDIQEFRTRYLFYRNLDDRIDAYRERLEEIYQQIQKPYFDHD